MIGLRAVSAAGAAPRYVQSDISVSQEFNISKSNERMKARVGAECFNCLNNHSATIFDQNLIRTSGLNPLQCGTAGASCPAGSASDIAGFDYAGLLSKGFNYISQANSQGRTFNSLYGNPSSWQDRRSIRLQVVVTF